MKITQAIVRPVLACLVILALCTLPRGKATRAATHHVAERSVYVALGDSTTRGNGAEFPVTQSFPALLARHLPHGARLLNLGIDGAGVQEALDTELPAALEAHPALVTLWVGWADVVFGSESAATYKAKLERIVTAFQHAHARIFIGTVPDMRIVPDAANGGVKFAKLARAFNTAINGVAARHGAVVVDIYGATRLLWPHPELQDVADQELNTQGYVVAAGIWYRTMHSHGAL